MNLEIELRGRLKAVEAQRNHALADHAVAEGSLAYANAENANLRAELEESKRRVAELEAKLAPLEPPKKD